MNLFSDQIPIQCDARRIGNNKIQMAVIIKFRPVFIFQGRRDLFKVREKARYPTGMKSAGRSLFRTLFGSSKRQARWTSGCWEWNPNQRRSDAHQWHGTDRDQGALNRQAIIRGCSGVDVAACYRMDGGCLAPKQRIYRDFRTSTETIVHLWAQWPRES